MIKKTIALLLAFACLHTHAQRITYNFNSNWKVFVGDTAAASAPSFNDAAWRPVTLPWAWNEDDAFKKDIKDLTTGIAWYRKHFRLPATAKGQKVFLEFEGIRQAGDFYLNGQHLGLQENGVTAFGFDITAYLNYSDSDNVLSVRIDNSWEYHERATKTKFQWEDKNFNANYGGINKNVYLHITGKTYQTLPLFTTLGTTGVYIYANQFNIKQGTATIHTESEIKNEDDKPQTLQYEVTITDADGKPVKTFTGDKTTLAPGSTTIVQAASVVNELHFWSWGYGYLYTVQTILKINGKPVDVVTTKTGFRKTEFKNGMIYLNDRVIMVHGYAQRTSNEWPAIGLSVPAWLSDYSNHLMVESNGNLVRWMHITPWKQDIESCDRVGLMEAMPAGDAEKDITGTRWEQRKAVMRDAIIYNRNNPSIIFFESGNESISEEHMKEMKAIRDQYDLHGGRAIGSREMLDSKVAEYGGEMLYTNKSAHIPLWAMEYSRDEGSRKFWDDYTPPYHKDGDGPLYNNQNAAVYNRNMESHAVENVKRWFEFWNERPGTGARVSAGGVNIVFAETNTHHRGAENYRRSGEVDALRIIKQNFYANQVMWDGWVNPEKYRIHIIGHWNYANGVKKDIYVVSSAAKVELKVNGRSLGFGQKSDGFLFTFKNVEWKPGSIAATGYDEQGKQLCETAINTVGEPAALRLTNVKRPVPFMADGHDLSLVEVEVVDAKGNRCPTALHMVNFTMDGPAEWRGGMAQGPDNYILAKSLPVENGVNRVLIRSTTTAGKITIKATAEGLQPATLTLTSLPFEEKNGLAASLPSASLPCRLERGPTPLTPSYAITRTPVAIVKATAGAHADSAFTSYDDNELSDWVNDGKLSTAWIEYELEREATVSEITLKLNNFRSRAYPLIITVDGKEVFTGSTKPTLGYYTIVCKPQKGKKVRIQLAMLLKEEGGEQMVEVSGKKLDDGVARDDSKAKGTLSIIEAEIYEPLKQ
ncbi:glycoside hydrolase family 2 protein [Niastella vici]|uniref:glycoside hydrolase family 2 protein n=1 Tax=Niastella vici TaxID=1703345 RepID=UPI001FE44362|nr:sugar-binding domain-containing protein [Niastella vici]